VQAKLAEIVMVAEVTAQPAKPDTIAVRAFVKKYVRKQLHGLVQQAIFV
jgi:hypothetical protein